MSSLRDDLQRLEERLALLDDGLQLAMAWHYGLRLQADEILDLLRADRPEDPAPRIEALERKMRNVRRTVQDLTQLVGSWDPEAARRPPPAPEPGGPAGRASAGPGAGEAPPAPAPRRPRSLTHARFVGTPAPGRDVALEALADGLEDGTPVTFAVGERGEPGDTIAASVQEGHARAPWYVPATLPPGTLLELVARAERFESRAIAVVDDGGGDGESGAGPADPGD
jgi:hypothetical protein